jgi:ADP-ribosyl-[dinitrogen reductase] hydrolase
MLGAPVEFMDLAEIRGHLGSAGLREPTEAYGRVGAITDDTQMTLFTYRTTKTCDMQVFS